MTGFPTTPGSGRLTVVALTVMSAALAYPWRSVTDRWVLGLAVVSVLAALVWWRGDYLTTILGRRLRIWLRRNRIPAAPNPVHRTAADAVTTVLVRVDARAADLPRDLLAGNLDRYGLLCDSVRVITHTAPAASTTWIALTFSGARNLAALQGRSAQVPLQPTAENAARRLINHLRENGWTATLAEPDELPDLVAQEARELWCSIADTRGYLTTYAVDPSGAALATLAGRAAPENWTVLELAGTPTQVHTRAAAAIRTEDRPAPAGPLPGLLPMPGRQARALAALHPLSGVRLVAVRAH